MLAGRPVPIEAALHRFEQSSIPPELELSPPVVPPKSAEQLEQERIREAAMLAAERKINPPHILGKKKRPKAKRKPAKRRR